ncbi:hypothetical protein AB6N24_12270 [Cellulomonas sp. 179-A 4D5 NHS]|uniref:hypothetical protein n=1 Tax=Cellulomonas sp. 179-A 4D5 NHS TaxID=3142378 RepID=UPI00399FE54A
MIAAAVVVLAGCSGTESTTGYYAFVAAEDSPMAERCAQFFGEPDAIGERLGLTLYPTQEERGVCVYDTSDGGRAVLGLSKERPDEAQVMARGEGPFYAFLFLVTSDGSARPVEASRRTDLVSWLERRAGAVEDDFDAWVAALPPVEDGYVDVGGYEVDPSAGAEQDPLEGLLRTPSATVRVTSVVRHDFLMVDDSAVSAGDGNEFLLSDLTVTQVEDPEVMPSYSIEIDGEDRGSGTQEALSALVRAGTAAQVAVAVPSDAGDVRLVVRTGSDVQAISLIDGSVHDEGQSDRLEAAASGEVSMERTDPRMRTPEGKDLTFYPEQYYAGTVAWTLNPWSPTSGWAPKGQVFLALTLRPLESNKAFPLTPADITGVADGQEYGATSFDAASYTFQHLVPEDVSRVTAQLRITPDPVQLGSPSNWRDGYTLTGPIVYDLAIDPNQARAAQDG